jgi:hypothetical protein
LVQSRILINGTYFDLVALPIFYARKRAPKIFMQELNVVNLRSRHSGKVNEPFVLLLQIGPKML